MPVWVGAITPSSYDLPSTGWLCTVVAGLYPHIPYYRYLVVVTLRVTHEPLFPAAPPWHWYSLWLGAIAPYSHTSPLLAGSASLLHSHCSGSAALHPLIVVPRWLYDTGTRYGEVRSPRKVQLYHPSTGWLYSTVMATSRCDHPT